MYTAVETSNRVTNKENNLYTMKMYKVKHESKLQNEAHHKNICDKYSNIQMNIFRIHYMTL